MDDWHRKLARDLVAETPAGSVPGSDTALEIAFGHARSELTYALELARAHRLPATGNIAGDDVWLQLGNGRVRFTLNRREGHVVVIRPGQDEIRVRAEGIDLGAMAREAIDALVAAWRAGPAEARALTALPRSFEDEPTKG